MLIHARAAQLWPRMPSPATKGKSPALGAGALVVCVVYNQATPAIHYLAAKRHRNVTRNATVTLCVLVNSLAARACPPGLASRRERRTESVA